MADGSDGSDELDGSDGSGGGRRTEGGAKEVGALTAVTEVLPGFAGEPVVGWAVGGVVGVAVLTGKEAGITR